MKFTLVQEEKMLTPCTCILSTASICIQLIPDCQCLRSPIGVGVYPLRSKLKWLTYAHPRPLLPHIGVAQDGHLVAKCVQHYQRISLEAHYMLQMP